MKYLIGGAVFHQLATPHHRNIIGQVVHHPQVMRDEKHRNAHLPHQFRQQIQNLALNRDIERRHRLIGQQKRGFRRNGAGNGNALALTAGKFMRVFVHMLRAEPHAFHEGSHGLLASATRQGLALAECLSQGGKYAETRIQGSVGVLEYHLEIQPAAAHLTRRQGRQLGAIQHNATAGDRLQLHDGAGKSRFATAALPHQPQDTTPGDRERDIVHRAHYLTGSTPGIAHREMHAYML